MADNDQRETQERRTEYMRRASVSLGLISLCFVALIVILSYQLRETLFSEHEQIQNNDVYIQRQIGSEIFQLSKSFERFMNNVGSFNDFIVRYDILYSRVDHLDKTAFFDLVVTKIGYEETVRLLQRDIKALDKYLIRIEQKDPDAVVLFRHTIDEIVTRWEGFSHAVLGYRVQEKNAWRDLLIANSYKIAIVLVILFCLFCAMIVLMVRQISSVKIALQREKELSQALSETTLKLREAANAKDKFLSTMSHEVRTPLNAISGFAQLLLHSKLDGKQEQQVNIIDNSARRLENMFGDILDYVDIGKSTFDPSRRDIDLKAFEMDIRLSIQRQIDRSQKVLGLSCDIDAGIHTLTLHSDPILIKRTLMHFTNNAIKHSDTGKLTFYIKFHPDNPEQIRMGLKDQGSGIEEGFKDKVFNAFSQSEDPMNRSIEGSGMGLAISSKLISLLGGHIDFESKVSVGSNFWIDLPIKKGGPN